MDFTTVEDQESPMSSFALGSNSGGMLFSQQFIEIATSPHDIDSDKAFQKVFSLAGERDIGDPPTIAGPPGTASAMNQIYNEFRWNEIIEGAVFEDVRVSVLILVPSAEPEYHRIVQGALFCCWNIIPKLESLGTTVRRWIRSLRPSDIRNISFRRLQEKNSMDQNVNVLATFLAFLLRNTRNPIPNFTIVLHPNTETPLQCWKNMQRIFPDFEPKTRRYTTRISV
ncbi:hypothetical protein BDP27DRAFT_274648 [Rhodocollybia butyracea]|uniref:Uncharacterized protein n=1 Tax=Rhodocollybia butyracea TaxID=206335 RepID=A0A9P5PG14_9AGAR|nr:hypothetical protein BDP27DRAFT_274648 [Rhodocollybia butyracea]